AAARVIAMPMRMRRCSSPAEPIARPLPGRRGPVSASLRVPEATMGMPGTGVGGGSWGTALAIQRARCGHDVVLWDRNPERCAHMNSARTNPRYLVGVPLPSNLRAEPDLARAVASARLVVPVLPSHGLRDVAARFARAVPDGAVVCCA